MYAINQSPLYKLSSKKKLADLLRMSTQELMGFAEKTEVNYNTFPVYKNKKSRWVQAPKPKLKAVHKRLFQLLGRISYPDYLHSGVKGRSYVTNAERHVGERQLYKLDIKSFFPSVSIGHIYYFFHNRLKCAPDVSWKLQRLCTYGDMLPTGSCISQIMAFNAYEPMFCELNELANGNGAVMTCYVDDLTFSGRNISGRFQYSVKEVIKKNGLSSHKEHFYGQSARKTITGVIVDGDALKVPNKQQLSIYQTMKRLAGLPPGEEQDAVLRSLKGRCSAAGLIDERFKNPIST